MPEFFLNRISLRTIIFISGIVLFVAFLALTLILLIPRTPGKKNTTEKVSTSQSRRFSITEFYLDKEFSDFFEQKTYPVRDFSSGWDKKEVDKFFIPVNEILHEYFQKKNDNYIKELFNTVD
ncbi:MAG: hypothetical protein JXJ04_20895 [Spirochaetales bacterium]|nr:hypothetical protein [Spirochaetales bacterium]